jgi:D-alanine-D-alanine ligase-like ATP-grasp enzyme
MKSIKRMVYSWVDGKFLGGCSSYNSLDVRRNCRSKFQARAMFAALDIPHAKGEVFINPYRALKFARKYGFPLVIKPNVSGFSRGSHFPIRSYGELLLAIFFAKGWWPSTVVEQYLDGKNYRVVVAGGEIMSVIRRYPPFVDGDGMATIDILIDRENAVRQEMGLGPVIHPIAKDGKVKKYLHKQGLSFNSVPAEGQRVFLFFRVALAPGGVVETIDKETMAPENRDMFLRLLAGFQASILGIDAIFKEGIETSYRQQQSILLEVNSRPYLKMHHYPRYGKVEDLSSHYDYLTSLAVEQQDIY